MAKSSIVIPGALKVTRDEPLLLSELVQDGKDETVGGGGGKACDSLVHFELITY